MQITTELIEKITSTVSKGLTKGLGDPKPGQMCVEAAICFAIGEEHTDRPSCVGEEIRSAKISLNDCNWSSDLARAEGMKFLAVAQLGSDQIDQHDFVALLKFLSTKRILPYLIQKHYDILEVKDNKLLAYKARFESLTELNNELLEEFYHYHNYHNYYHYYHYYYNYYHNNYYSYYHHYHYHCYFDDDFLLLIADVILETLEQLKSPGCEWLHLVK